MAARAARRSLEAMLHYAVPMRSPTVNRQPTSCMGWWRCESGHPWVTGLLPETAGKVGKMGTSVVTGEVVR